MALSNDTFLCLDFTTLLKRCQYFKVMTPHYYFHILQNLVAFSIKLVILYINKCRELIQINIKIKKRNRFKGLFYKMYNRTEDILFLMIQNLPLRLVPKFLIVWFNKYMDKRLAELKKQIVHDKWQSMELHEAVKIIRQQAKNKAPSGN